MNMWRFISLVAVEEEPIRPNDFHCGHYYASLSHHPAKQDIKFSVVSHPFRRSRANAQAKLRALMPHQWRAVSCKRLLAGSLKNYKSSGLRPVRFPMRANIRGPISSLS